MRKLTSLQMVFFVLLSSFVSNAQTILSHETFPGTFNTAFNKPINSSFNGTIGTWNAFSTNSFATVSVNNAVSKSAPNALELLNYNSSNCPTISYSIATSPVISCNTVCASSVKLVFDINPFCVNSTNNSYSLYLQISSDNGSTWTTIYNKTAAQLANEIGQNTWSTVSITLPAAFNNANFRYRFSGAQAAYCSNNTFIYLDNICISYTPCNNQVCPIGGINISNLTKNLFFFSNGSKDANWQGASKGFVGDALVDGITAKERTSGNVPYAGTMYTNDVTLSAWQNIVDDNAGQAFASYSQTSLINNAKTELENAFSQINALPVSAGFSSISTSSLNGLNKQNGIAETFVINVTSGFNVSSKINITGDASDIFILRWDTDANFSNGYNGQVKFQSGGAIVPLGGLLPSNFIHVAGDLNASGGGNTPATPYPQGPRKNNGTGSLINGASDFSGGGFFTGYWLTTGEPTITGSGQPYGETAPFSNAIFVGGWYTKTTKFSMTSGTSGVHVAPPACPVLSLGDLVWYDINNNGIKEANENGVANVQVNLYADANNDNIADGATLATTTTDNIGNYLFSNLNSGNYIVGIILPNGYENSATPSTSSDPNNNVNNDNNGVNLIGNEVRSNSINLTSGNEPNNGGDANLTLDFGLTGQLSLGNLVWNDYDGDGKKDFNEPGISGVPVSLYSDTNGDNQADTELPIASITTNNLGNYTFSNLIAGKYIVSMPLMPGYSPSPNTTTINTSPFPDNYIDNDNNAVNNVGGILSTNAITIFNGAVSPPLGGPTGNTTLDMAMCGNAYIGGIVWKDLNSNGIREAGEPGINGQTVFITFSDGTIAQTTTLTFNGQDGYYDFKNLGPGNYIITFVSPSGLQPTLANQGSDDTKDSDPINGSVTVVLQANISDFTIDAGFIEHSVCGLGNLLFIDLDGDNLRNATEPGIPDATVHLYADANYDNVPDGAPIVTTQSNTDGSYGFTNLAAGSYIVGVVLPPGYQFSSGGSVTPDDNIDNDNNGVRLSGNEVQTNYILLAPASEPTYDGDDNNINSTLDIALKVTFCPPNFDDNVTNRGGTSGTTGFNTFYVNELKVYPNPATSNYNLKITAEKQGSAAVWIVDQNGRLVSNKLVSIFAGINIIPMNVDIKMGSGVYTIQSMVNGKLLSKRLVIAK